MTQVEVKMDRTMAGLAEAIREPGFKNVLMCDAELQNQLRESPR